METILLNIREGCKMQNLVDEYKTNSLGKRYKP